MKRKGKFRALAALLLALMMVAGSVSIVSADVPICEDGVSCYSCNYSQYPCCGPDVVYSMCRHSDGTVEGFAYCAYVCSPQP
jgi:hypothetical protein